MLISNSAAKVRCCVDAGDCATSPEHMAPEYGVTAAMFFIDQEDIRLPQTHGRDDKRVALVETTAKTQRQVW